MLLYKCNNKITVTGEVNRQRLVELAERQRWRVQWESDASAAEASWQDAANETTAQDDSHRQRGQQCGRGHARRYAHFQPRQERLLLQLVRSVHPLSHSHTGTRLENNNLYLCYFNPFTGFTLFLLCYYSVTLFKIFFYNLIYFESIFDSLRFYTSV